MSKYTTGELAKQCGVSVRTVQFYDTKGLLHPSELTEGGRRLYTDTDLKQMKLICLLKSLGLSLESIKGILQSEHPEKVLLLLLDEQEKQLDAELAEKAEQKRTIAAARACLEKTRAIPENLQSGIETIMMENRKRKLRRVHVTMVLWGSLCTIAEVLALMVWGFNGNWIPFAVVLPIAIVICTLLTRMYYRSTVYLCPACGAAFRPLFREFLFAGHTPKTRKLTCTHCGKKDWCVETAEDQ